MSVSDPKLIVLYPCDESGPMSSLVNRGAAGSPADLYPVDSCSRPADGHGGRAIDMGYYNATYGNAYRDVVDAHNFGKTYTERLALGETLPTFPQYLFDGASGATYGFRFYIPDTGYAGDGSPVWGLRGPHNYPLFYFRLAPNGTGVDPSSWVMYLNSLYTGTTRCSEIVHLGGGELEYADGENPADGFPILTERWYRVIVRIVGNDGDPLTENKGVLDYWQFDESTGLYTHLTSPTGGVVIQNAAALEAAKGYAQSWWAGVVTTDRSRHYLDEAWYRDAPYTDEEVARIGVGGISIPWVEPSLRRADHVVHIATAGDLQDFPKTRPLPTGALVARHPTDVRCQRARFRYEGWRPGRPWCLRDVQGLYDTAGPFNARRAYPFSLKALNTGLYRTPGELPSGAWQDVRNVECTEVGPRRRRGFQILRDVDDAYDTGANAFFTFRNFANALHIVYKVGTSLWGDNGGGDPTEIATSWALNELPVFLYLDNRAIILSTSKRVTWTGDLDGAQSFGVPGPNTFVGAVGAGGLLDGYYYYAYTLYDSDTGDETAPRVLTSVLHPTGGQRVTLTMDGTDDLLESQERYDVLRIYRTTNGGSAPNFFYIDQMDISAGASSTYYDDGEPDGTNLVDQVQDNDGNLLGYMTSELPDDFSVGCVHMERAFYTAGATYPERIYASEANKPMQFYDAFYMVADGGPIKALISWGHRLVAYTDNTIEFFESDWIRDASGYVNVQRTVVTRSVGVSGPHAVANVAGDLVWMDRRGLWRNPSNPKPIGDPQVQDLIPYVNHGLASRIVVSFNHVRRQVWVSVPQAQIQEDNTRFQTVYVQHIDKPERWSLYDIEASFHGKFDYDLQGLIFGVMDHLGVMKWAESYEGDGAQGDEDYTTEDEGTDDYDTSPAGILSVSGKIVTVYGTTDWTTDALRGMGVILRVRSTGALHYYTIQANTADTFTAERTVSADLAAGDGYHIGGMDAYVEFAAQQFGSPNKKIIRQVQTQFMGLTGDLYL